MEKEKAWNLFINTGKIEDYLNYRSICNDEYEDDEFEINKDNWNSNKRDRF